MSKPHSEFPASSAARLIACPGSLQLTRDLAGKGFPIDRPSIYAAQGTVAHTIAENLLAHRGDKVRQAEMRGTYMLDEHTVDGHQIIVDQDFLDHVQVYVDYIETLEAFDYELHFEAKVSPHLPWTAHGRVPPFNLYGTADCWGIQRQRGDIVVIDLKFGSGVKVAVEENAQLLYYALGVLSGLATRRDTLDVELVIIQPRVLGGGPKLWNSNVGSIVAWGETVLRPAVEACLDPLASLHAGDHCKWCPAKAHCPELARLAHDRIRELFNDGGLQALNMVAVPPSKLSDDLLLATTLELWIEALREEAIRRLEAGEPVAHHKLVEKRAIRKWINPEAAVALAAKHGVNIVDGVMTPAQAEKAVPVVDFKPFYEKKSSGLTLAHESDPRPAMTSREKLLQNLKGSLQ